ncbi:MAG TPA: magnesium/cobalt transporter CorA [Candidatus Cloacimonetes bacterium]|nr:magnesium/cobalt transporter CorA [Candidatus Cloacimonadota bacterium]HEX37650.1 magnesium/cobalt transporter CorA [Candidatus Cloacimonadota bacterium]
MDQKRASKFGTPPGTLIHIGKQKMENVHISVIDYNEATIDEREVSSVEECKQFVETSTVTWINVDGIHDSVVMEDFRKYFDLHPLLLEDIMNTNQRPKVEDYGSYLYFVLKMIYLENGESICYEQVSIILGKNYVITFQERTGDVFDIIRQRLRNAKGRIRKANADYLAYTLVDSIIDHYFIILEKVGDSLEDLEEEVVKNPTTETIQNIHKMKRKMVGLRKSIWPLREIIGFMERSESDLIDPSVDIYLRDLYDHTIQVIDTLESYRDMVSGLLDIYLSSISNKMNEVMKMLTIIATIFIPLTFIAGVYGMNFAFMPELQWKFGYFAVLFVMLIILVGMILYFKRKRWL